MNIPQKLAAEFQLRQEQIDNTIALLDDGKTIPFIARYRKERTGSLDDQVLRAIDNRLQYLRKLEQRKEEICTAIEAQGKLTPELEEKIRGAETLVETEDLYLPYRPKRKTRASMAIARGLEPLARILMAQNPQTNPAQEAEAFLQELPHTYYEENNLHMQLISDIKDYERCLAEVKRFLPYINNWATCDIPRPKCFAKHKTELLPVIKEWIASGNTYTIRYGIGTLMSFYLDEDFKPEYIELVASVQSEEYYVNMMIAWYLATALAKQWDATIPYLEERKLSPWVHRKTIQKAVESYRITDEQKVYLKTLRENC